MSINIALVSCAQEKHAYIRILIFNPNPKLNP